MKILYKTMGLGLLSACLCLLCAAPASAKVCFVGDENCGAGGSFEPAEELPNEDLCRQEGYTSLASTCLNPGGTCPYDARYVKCCGAEYAYQACVFPLETVKIQNSEGKTVADKCGSLFKCKCNSEYKTPADWSSQASSACQPGGGVCIMSTTDTVYYNKCVCDVNYFPYEGSCPDNMTQIESCRDSDGKTRVSCQCPSNYRTCTYGGAPGAKSCKQGGLTLYSSCKSAEDECENAGYFKDCYTQTCYYDTNSTIYDKGRYPTSCEDSYEACPYAYGFYKCRWSAESYCAKWDMTEYSKQLPSTCTKDGVQGTVIPCNLGGSYNGGGSTSNYLGYYRCKLTCEQQLRAAYSQGYLSKDDSLVDMTGQQVFYRTDASGRNHLYLINDLIVPLKTEKSKHGWDTIGNKKNYASVNGMGALYDFDSKRYSSCEEERTKSKRPKLKLDHMRIQATSKLLNVDLSDVNVEFYYSDYNNSNSYGESYYIGDHTWKNVSFSDTTSMPKACTKKSNDSSKIHYILRDDCKGGWAASRVFFDNNSHTTITGEFDTTGIHSTYYEGQGNDEFNGTKTHIPSVQFVLKEKSVVTFKDAFINVSKGANVGSNTWNSDYSSWSGEDWATLLFVNSKGTMGHIWHRMNVGFMNSDLQIRNLRVYGWRNNNLNTTFGGSYDNVYSRNCHGIYLRNSHIFVDGVVRVGNDYSKLYVNYSSTFETKKHLIMVHSKNTELCAGGTFSGNTKGSTEKFSSYKVLYGQSNNTCVPYWTGNYSVNKGYATGCAQKYWYDGYNGSWNRSCEKKKDQNNKGFQCYLDNKWNSACWVCESYGMGYNG